MLFHKISGIVLSSLFRFSFSKTFYWLKACFDNEDVVVHSLKFSSSFNWKFRHREPCFSLNYLNYHGNWFFFSWADAACLFSLHFLENCLPQIFHLSGFFFSWTDLTCWASESVEKITTNIRPERLKTLKTYHQNHPLIFFLFNIHNEFYWHFWVYFDIDLKLISGKNNRKVNKQDILDSQNWVFDELNEI